MENETLAKDVYEIKNTLQKLQFRLELMHTALGGNELLKDGGLIGDILIQKAEILTLQKRVALVETKEDKRQIYIRITWGVVGALLTILINYFFHK